MLENPADKFRVGFTSDGLDVFGQWISEYGQVQYRAEF